MNCGAVAGPQNAFEDLLRGRHFRPHRNDVFSILHHNMHGMCMCMLCVKYQRHGVQDCGSARGQKYGNGAFETFVECTFAWIFAMASRAETSAVVCGGM